MNTKLSATGFVHWYWTFLPERKLIFINEKTPCYNQIEDMPNSAIVTWKRSWLLHKYNWRALWQLIIKGKKSMPIQLTKKRTIPLPSVGNFTLASQMWSTRTLAIYPADKKAPRQSISQEKNCLRATSLPSQDLRKLYKGELTTLGPLFTEIKKAPSQPKPPKDKQNRLNTLR